MIERTTTAVIPAGEHPASSPRRSGPSNTPRGLQLEVIEGPLDGFVLSLDTKAETFLGRGIENTLPLHGDMLVSSRHARLLPTEDPSVYMVEDLGSANGTWLDGDRLIAPHPLRVGGAFLAGQSVMRLQSTGTAENHLPGIDQLGEERSRLLEKLSPDLRQTLGAATMLACRERRGYVNDRHFFLGLAMSCPDLPPFARGRGKVPFDSLDDLLCSNAQWTGVDGWIDERLRDIPISNFFSTYLPLCPRVLQSLLRAEDEARDRGHETIEAEDWLRVALAEPQDRVHRVLDRLRLDPPSLLESLGKGSGRPAPRPKNVVSTGAVRVKPSEDKGTDALLHLPSVSSGDPAVDHHAQELARRLYGLAALYHLATPEDRRTAMQHLLRQEMADWPSERQRRLLVQLRGLFPLDPGSTQDAAEVENLRNQIAQLQHRVEELEKNTQGPARAGVPWHLIIESGKEAQLESFSPVEMPRLHFLRELYQFGVKLELFVTGLVQNFRVQAGSTTSLALPGHQISLRAYVDDMAAGRPVRIDALQQYLADIEAWLVAGLAAYHEAPEAWFKKFWQRASPAAIEARVGEGWAKKLGLQYSELWKDYKEAVRKLNPEFVSQSIQHEVRQIAQERKIKISQGRL